MELPNTISACHDLLIKQQEIITAQAAMITELTIQVKHQSEHIKKLTTRIEQLEEQVNKNSKNSNKPPASDGLAKAPAFPRKRGGRRGGKIGHKGKTLDVVQTPDLSIPLLPEKCVCGQPLDKTKALIGERRQVFDLPEPKLKVIEYQKLVCHCGRCGLEVTGTFPDRVKSRVQYGSGVRSFTTLLNCGFSLPVKKVQQLFMDLSGYKINEGTILNNNTVCHTLLESTETVIKDHLLKEKVGHSDESGVRVAGKLHWLHVFSSTLFTYFFVHSNRGKKALEDTMSLIPNFKGWLVHDCWKSYFKFTGCKHALCGAHLIRELTALDEKGIKWAKWFIRYLFSVYDLVEANGGVLSKEQQNKALKLFNKTAAYAYAIEPQPVKGKRGRPKSTKGRNLLNHLVQHREGVLAFAFHQEVPFTNNLEKRDLRPIKTKQKVSGSFRTLKDVQNHTHIYGFISTARKQQVNIFNELKKFLIITDCVVFEI